MATQAGSTQMSAAQKAATINQTARAAISANATKMQQLLLSTTINPATNPVLNVQPRNVGLILGFWVEVVHSVSNGSAVQIDVSDFGPLNSLAQIQLNDFNNTTRIQTAGWHLGLVNSVRARRPFGTALVKSTGIDSPIDYGTNWTGQISVISGGSPATSIAASGTGTVTMWYWVPLAYSDHDLRGAIYANVVNATMQLLLTMPGATGGSVNNNVTVCAANGSDSTQAMFVGHAAGSVAGVSITSTTVNVYQYYYDQLPMTSAGVLLPVTDLATVYELKYTIQSNIPQAQDFNYQYSNFRNFLGTTVVYVNNGTTGARGVGADINTWALQAANLTNIWKKTPALLALEFRNFFSTDLPPGCYYFGTRQRPINTTQYGNMNLVLNASSASNNAYQLIGVEDFALIQTLSMAGSLPTS